MLPAGHEKSHNNSHKQQVIPTRLGLHDQVFPNIGTVRDGSQGPNLAFVPLSTSFQPNTIKETVSRTVSSRGRCKVWQ